MFQIVFNVSKAAVNEDAVAVVESLYESDTSSSTSTPDSQTVTGIGNRYTYDFTQFSSVLEKYRKCAPSLPSACHSTYTHLGS